MDKKQQDNDVLKASLAEGASVHASENTAPMTEPVAVVAQQEQRNSAHFSKQQPEKHEKTYGEKKFNRITYNYGMFWANLVFSAGLSYFAQNHELGRKAYESLKQGYRAIGLKNETAIKNLTNAFTLMMGGHVLAAFFMKPMEDHKLELVKKWDAEHYGVDAEAIPEVDFAHKQLEKEEKTTTAGILTARMLSWTAVQASAYTLGAEENILRKFGTKNGIKLLEGFQGVDKYSIMSAEKLVETLPEPVVKAGNFVLRPLATAEHEKGFMRYMKEMLSDVMYTIITAVSISPINKHVVQKVPFFREKRQENLSQPLPSSAPPIAPELPTGSTIPAAELAPKQPTLPKEERATDQPSATIDAASIHGHHRFTPHTEQACFV